jgi:hypothetical protein
MNKRRILVFFVSFLTVFSANGQEETEEKSMQDYTPSILINKGQTEFKLFNSLHTQDEIYNELGERSNLSNRISLFTAVAEYKYGLSDRVTFGGEIWFKSTYVGSPHSSATNVLSFTNSSRSRSGIPLAGIKVKYNPVKKWERFSLQTGLLLNVISDPESEHLDRPLLDENRHLWITKFYYDKEILNRLYVFTQLTAWMSIDKNLANENTSLATPFDLYISYFVTKKMTVYLQNQLWPTYNNEGVSSYFIREGLGLKYILFNNVELDLGYTSFIMGENSGAGQSVNLGLRIIH